MTDDAAFEEFFRRCWAPVVLYARRRCEPGIEADDVAAEVFRLAWLKFADAPGHDTEVLWLYGIGRGVIANARKSRGRAVSLVSRLAAQRQPGRPGPFDDDGVSWLLPALDRLAEDDRELLRLVAWEELAPAEIAILQGRSVDVVRTRLHRARRRLRQRAPSAEDREGRRVSVAPTRSTRPRNLTAVSLPEENFSD